MCVAYCVSCTDEGADKGGGGKGGSTQPSTQPAGADGLRLALASMMTQSALQGVPVELDPQRVTDARGFVNKLWNAARFVLSKVGGDEQREEEKWAALGLVGSQVEPDSDAAAALQVSSRWILSRLARAVGESGRAMEGADIAAASHSLQAFFVGEYCDWYLEMAKCTLQEGAQHEHEHEHYEHEGEHAVEARSVLALVLDVSLRLAHPIIPFATETLWQRLQPESEDKEGGASLMAAAWPEAAAWDALVDEDAEAEVAQLLELVRAARRLVAETAGLKPRDAELRVKLDIEVGSALWEQRRQIEWLTKARSLSLVEPACGDSGGAERREMAVALPGGVACVVSVLLPPEKAAAASDNEGGNGKGSQGESRRVRKLRAEAEKLRKQLANGAFRVRAPAAQVEAADERLAQLERQLDDF